MADLLIDTCELPVQTLTFFSGCVKDKSHSKKKKKEANISALLARLFDKSRSEKSYFHMRRLAEGGGKFWCVGPE